MEGRPPPIDDEGFEWTDLPERPERGTGERPAASGPGESRPARGDTGEFERSGRTPPPGRRARHRDLPARVRRRQATVIGIVAVVLLVAFVALVSGGGNGGGEQEIGLKRLLGQTIVAKLGKKGPDEALLRRIRQGRVGGLIVFPGDPQSLAADVREAQAAAEQGGNPRLLVMIDQEGGSVKRLPQGPPDLTPRQLGAAGDEAESRDQGRATGQYLKGFGVNVDLAPVLDISEPETARTISSRTFGTDPETVSSVGVAFAEGLQEGGVLATPKHFPGLGQARVTTDERPVTIAATSEDLQTDIVPFEAAIDAEVKLMMVSSAAYPGLTPGSKEPAVFSPQIVRDLLRDQLGFDGAVITDDLEAPALEGSPGEIGARALQAGNDLLLYAKDTGASDEAFRALVDAVKQGQLDRARVADAYERITSLKGELP